MSQNTRFSTESCIARRFAAFRSANPQKTLTIGGVEWRYRPVGSGTTGLVMLPGSAGGGDAYFQLAEEMAKDFRCLLIDYSVVDGLDQMLAGLAAILENEGKQRFSIIGGSYGGMVAQALLLRQPSRVDRVVLNGTGSPLPARADKNERWQPVIRMIPISCLRPLLKLVVKKMSKQIKVDHDFWMDYYFDAANSITRADLESKYRASIDFDRSFGSLLEDLESWKGKILLTQGTSDKMADGQMQAGIQQAYPQATIHAFEGAGHGVSLERPDEWRAVVSAFLTGTSDRVSTTESQPSSVVPA